MGFKKGLGLGKNLQGRPLPVQVLKRLGKGGIGQFENEEINRSKTSQGNQPFSFFYFSTVFLFFSAAQKGEPAKYSKENSSSNASPYRKQHRRVNLLSYKTFHHHFLFVCLI